MTFTITENSTPVYDTFGFAAYWGCDDWVTWHKLMVVKFGRAKADKTWVDAWLAGVSSFSGGKGTAPGSGFAFDSVPLSCRTFDSAFRTYIQANAALKSAAYTGFGGLIAKPLGAGVDVITAGSDAISNTTDGLGSFFKIMKYALPVLLIGGGIYIIYKGAGSLPKLALK